MFTRSGVHFRKASPIYSDISKVLIGFTRIRDSPDGGRVAVKVFERATSIEMEMRRDERTYRRYYVTKGFYVLLFLGKYSAKNTRRIVVDVVNSTTFLRLSSFEMRGRRFEFQRTGNVLRFVRTI